MAARKRVNAPGMGFGLPPLDTILVSQPFTTMDKSDARSPRAPTAPARADAARQQIHPAPDGRRAGGRRAFDWGQSAEIRPVRIHFRRPQHWSAAPATGACACGAPFETGWASSTSPTGYGGGRSPRPVPPPRVGRWPTSIETGAVGSCATNIDPEEAVQDFPGCRRRRLSAAGARSRLTDEGVLNRQAARRRAGAGEYRAGRFRAGRSSGQEVVRSADSYAARLWRSAISWPWPSPPPAADAGSL